MTHHLNSYNKSGAGGFASLSSIAVLQSFVPYFERPSEPSKPKRKSMQAPTDEGLFIKPIKQCFIRNPRLMPMTRMMLTLLSGWAGQGGSIKTTISIIAKHVGRSPRMVFNYLQDAAEEGYLYYSRTKDRIGRYTGICVRLNFSAIRYTPRKSKTEKPADSLAMKLPAKTNSKYLYNTKKDDVLSEKLERFGKMIAQKEQNQSLE